MPVVDGGMSALNAEPGACDWPIDTTCIPDWLTAYTAEQRERATALATFILDGLTGRQFAQCPVVVRPCGSGCGSVGGYTTWPVAAPAASAPGMWMVPYIVGGVWRNCMCSGGCTCAPACRVDLGGPVAEIVTVKVDGLTLDPAAYQLIGSWLARVDGGECWPSCQDPATADTEQGTFSVTYRPGRLLPRAGEIAAGMLAAEFAKACAGTACALPQNLSSLTRQGVEVEIVNPTDVLTEGYTGIREVDLFLRAVNPSRLARRARVLSPDIGKGPVIFG